MKLFYKRPLALILCIMVGGFSFLLDVDLAVRIAIAISSLAAIGLIFIFKDKFSGRMVLSISCCLALSVSIFLGMIFNSLFYPHKYYGKSLRIEATVQDVDHTRTDISTMVIRTAKIGEDQAAFTMTTSGSKDDFSGIVKGHKISLIGTVTPYANTDDGFDIRSYYTTKGYSAFLSAPSDVVIEDYTEPSLVDSAFTFLRDAIRSKLHLQTNRETGPLLTALLTGERDNLTANTNMNFLRTGISHILALSGSHIVLLAAFVSKLLGIFRVSKKPKMLLTLLFTVLYMALTGFTVSVVRAGLMMMVYASLYVFSLTKDSVTSLFISVSIILLFQPHAAYDISLWLSASATLGIIFFSYVFDNAKKEDSIFIKISKAFVSVVLSSVFAIGLSSIFSIISFEEVSLLGVVATIVFTVLTELLIYLSIAILLFGSFLPFLGDIAIFFGDITHNLAELWSNAHWVAVSIDFLPVKLFSILLIVAIIAFLLLDLKKYRKAFFIILPCLLLATYISGAIMSTQARVGEQFVYSPDEDSIVIKSNQQISVISSSGSGSVLDIREILHQDRIMYVDRLVYSTYTNSLYKSAEQFLSSYKTNELYVPEPINYEERAIAEALSGLLGTFGTDLIFYNTEDKLELGNIDYRLHTRKAYSFEETTDYLFTMEDKENTYAFFSRGGYTAESTIKRSVILKSDVVIIGSIGSYSSYINTYSPSVKQIITGFSFKMNESIKAQYEENGASVSYTEAPITIKFAVGD